MNKNKQNKEIKNLKKQLKKYKSLCIIDDLTGLYNRRKFEKDLDRFCYEKRRYNTKFSLIMFDLDNFKTINDKYGHKTGDKILKYFSKILIQNTRKSDRVYRFQGDEFMILLPNTPNKLALKIAKRIQNEFANVSFGISSSKYKKKILETVDKKMYKNKKQRKLH